MSTILVAGATGMTGRCLVEQLLAKGHEVRAVVRSMDSISEGVGNHPNVTFIEASLLDMTDEEMAEQVKGCDAIVSCLGHNISFKGMYGAPRQLCTEATRRLCMGVERNRPENPVKFVLMNTVHPENCSAFVFGLMPLSFRSDGEVLLCEEWL